MGDRDTGHWPLLFMMSSKSSSSKSTFLVRPIWPSLGALWPSLCGLAPPSWPFTWGCPGLYWPAGPGCLGGPLGGISSGIPEAPYISAPAERVSPGWPLDVDKVQASWSNGNSGFSLPQQHTTVNVWTSVDNAFKVNRENVRVAFHSSRPRRSAESTESALRERCCCLSEPCLSSLSLSAGTTPRQRRFKGASRRFLGLGDFLALCPDS